MVSWSRLKLCAGFLSLQSLIGFASDPTSAQTIDTSLLHSYEHRINHHLTSSVLTLSSSSTLRFSLTESQCVDRVEVTAKALSGKPVLFLMGAEALTETPLDQDYHFGTITLNSEQELGSGTPMTGKSVYRFRVSRMVRQTSVVVAGGDVQILSASSVVVPSERCPLMSKYQAHEWAKKSQQLLAIVEAEDHSFQAKEFSRIGRGQARILEFVSNGAPDLIPATRFRAPDTNPIVRNSALSLACTLQAGINELSQTYSEKSSLYQTTLMPLMNIVEKIFTAYFWTSGDCDSIEIRK